MSSVPDSLDPHDIAVAAHDTGAASLSALLKDAGLDITANRWLPGEYFEANASP